MKAVALLVALTAGGCSACGSDHPAQDATPIDAAIDGTPFTACGGDPASFTRQAFLALVGHRPASQSEVDVYVDLYHAAIALGDDPKATVARAIMNRPDFGERWVDIAMDQLHVQRTDVQAESSCWDQAVRDQAHPTATLATAVRDHVATGVGDGSTFTMLDLARSTMVLDDMTPMWRAQVFSMLSHPIPAANVDALNAELARRADFGATFDAAYLHRDVVCLACHNSAASVTDNDDRLLDRFWPAPGLPENVVYEAPRTEQTEARAHAVLRVDNFVFAGAQVAPWGWSGSCGRFNPNPGPDIAGVNAKLGSITGNHATAFDLDAALQRGFAALRSGAPTGAITDPDTALAWLVTLKMTEDVWKQVTGTQLTIANYFPRNEASRDVLVALAGKFATSGYSLRALLAAIVATDYFDRLPPEAGCGEGPYSYPNVYDPWVIGDSDPAKRHNGPGDAITALDARTLIRATAAALEWPAGTAFGATRFPGGFEESFQRGIGAFLRNSERGFRGLDFQASLVWEDQYGTCARPPGVASDFIDRLAAAGVADATATTADLIAALKERLVGEPAIAPGAEQDTLVALLGPLDAKAASVSATKLRIICGALLDSPQFLMMGMAAKGGMHPKLTPMTAGYAAVCQALATSGIGVAGRVVTCTGGMLQLTGQ